MSHDSCPPHNWWIESAKESDIGEERWTCRRCGTVKLPRRVVARHETNELGLSNTSTVNGEDLLMGGWDEPAVGSLASSVP